MSRRDRIIFRIGVFVIWLAVWVFASSMVEASPLPCAEIVESGGARLRVVKPRGPVPRHYRALSVATCRAVRAEAERQGVPVAHALATAQHESHFDPFAMGPDSEIGPMQAKPMHCRGRSDCDPVEAGVRYVGALLERAGGDRSRAYAAYRCGWAGSRSWPPQCREYSERLTLREDRIRALLGHAQAPREGRRDRSASAAGLRLAPWARMHGAPPNEVRDR